MAVESKPLFHPEVIRQQVRSFNLPARVQALQPYLQHWADLLASGRADDFKESDLLPDFLTDIFCHLLGYQGRPRQVLVKARASRHKWRPA
jgi:hypothetical protein